MGVFNKIFGTASERHIKKLMPTVERINELYEEYAALSDDELRAKTDEFRRRILEQTIDLHKELIELDNEISTCQDADEIEELRDQRERLLDEIFQREQEVLNEILPEAFAVVKETCRRLVGTEFTLMGQKMVWDMIPYDVQLIGAIVLHEGKIAEMATGEGKTLVATMPLYLNALAFDHNWVKLALNRWGDDIDKYQFVPLEAEDETPIPPGRGVHLVTVNDYLARRDAQWMGMIYNFLGLTVGVVHEGIQPSTPERKEQYLKDITYGTNNAFGFDYLRDNMAVAPEGVVQREHYYAIIDEVDSVLIDEARTPLIISGPVESSIAEKYRRWNGPVRHLVSLQMRESANLLANARRLWKKAEDLEAEGKGGEASKIRGQAATMLLMVKRSTPKNPQYLKLIKEPEILKAVNHEEAIRLRDKTMNELDEKLYFVVDEHENSINLTDKGREELARFSKKDKEIFVLPDLADELSKIEGDEELSEAEKQRLKQKVYKKFAERSEINHAISQLLKAYVMFAKDVDYVVQQGKVIIVDEFTGRLMPGRRYSEGLHQALEAKEGVKVAGETQTYASITLQNYFRMYRKLAGMTGTAMTEAPEFWEIYKLDVIQIPTNRPVRRVDFNDRVYLTRKEKFTAVIDEIEFYHKRGQPVLVGTVSVEVSEMLSRILKRKNIPHSVLNAKHHEKEAQIVARAGQPGAVTIATNMAGRGTDIKLGIGVVKAYELVFTPIVEKIAAGTKKGKSYLLVAENGEVLKNLASIVKHMGLDYKIFPPRGNAPKYIPKFLSTGGKVALFPGFELSKAIPEGKYEKLFFPKPKCAIKTEKKDEWTCPADPKECIRQGVPCGLHIIGTERHEARRIDNQLRGRAGRQGDPGSSRFFLSLQDDLMRLYAGGDRAYNMIKRLNPPEGQPIEHALITKQIAAAQKRVEAQNFAIRKRLLEYDDVANKQREVIYNMRRNILFNQNLIPDYKKMMREYCEDLVELYTDPDRPPESWDWDGLSEEFAKVFLVRYKPEDVMHPSESLADELYELALKAFQMKCNIIGEENCRLLQRAAYLATIDQLWKEHLRALDEIKESSQLAAYAQRDPIIEFKKQAFDAFEQLIDDIREQTLLKFFHAQIVGMPLPQRRVPLREVHQGTQSYGVSDVAKVAQSVFGSGQQSAEEELAPVPAVGPGFDRNPGRETPARAKPQTIRRKGKKIGRNDPCPCGSGKKYKNCCGRNVV